MVFTIMHGPFFWNIMNNHSRAMEIKERIRIRRCLFIAVRFISYAINQSKRIVENFDFYNFSVPSYKYKPFAVFMIWYNAPVILEWFAVKLRKYIGVHPHRNSRWGTESIVRRNKYTYNGVIIGVKVDAKGWAVKILIVISFGSRPYAGIFVWFAIKALYVISRWTNGNTT